MDLPKTLILGIFTHGEQPLDNTTYSQILTNVPPNMTIHKIDVVLPGVANVSTVENFENIGNNISELINNKKINWDELSSEQVSDLTTLLATTIVNENDNMVSKINEDYNYGISKRDTLPFLSQFVHTSSHPMRILKYRENEEMPDKLFTRIKPGELLNPDEIPENYSGKIVMLNVEGQPDIFEIIEGFDDTPFSGLNVFFEEMGVTNLIVLDFSCNVFQNIKPGTRDARVNRRAILREENSIKIPKKVTDDRSRRLKTRKLLSNFPKIPKKKGGKYIKGVGKYIHNKTKTKTRKISKSRTKK